MPSEDGSVNLWEEGIAAERIFRVGNVMIVWPLPALRISTLKGIASPTLVLRSRLDLSNPR